MTQVWRHDRVIVGNGDDAYAGPQLLDVVAAIRSLAVRSIGKFQQVNRTIHRGPFRSPLAG
jgi:hypothetical protein